MAFAKLNSMKFVGLDGLSHFWTNAKTWIINRITTEVTAKIAEIVANAPEDLDTLKEIADWISSHANDAAAMNTTISTNASEISSLKTSVAGKSDTGHTHTKSEITDFPTSLPANGGTADSATNATNDSNGNNIANTYMPKSGGTFSGSVTFKGNIRSTVPDSYISFTPGDIEINAENDVLVFTPGGSLYVNNGLIIDSADLVFINSHYGYKRLDSYIKRVVADSSVPK